ncbi:MAG: pallilysin-related adhesin [Treponema sp.]|nr:pallilysin-related adhesin [Treponema sp.]
MALVLGFIIIQPWDRLFPRKNGETQQPRIIIPREREGGETEFDSSMERMAYEDITSTKIALRDGEVMLSVLTQDLDEDPMEEQIIAYRNLPEAEGPVRIAYVDYDGDRGGYLRVWDAPTAVTKPLTFSMRIQDLVGDRSVCVVVTGMGSEGVHTLSVFRRIPPAPGGKDEAFKKIADIRIDGSIRIQESGRPQSYQRGISRGTSFPIAAYGHDPQSENILDQVEIIYTYNSAAGQYEQNRITRAPGPQIEQRRLRELLSGSPGVFENFIHDLWYSVGPGGTLDSRRYIYFDPASREITFFEDGAQQIFTWQNSSPTRYGLYVATQSVSVTTLRRTIDIELESTESIRVKVFEDVRLKISADNTWDGSYRRARSSEAAPPPSPYIDALYESSLGKIRFFPGGAYEIRAGENLEEGHYAFFPVDSQEALEMRPRDGGPQKTYLVERSGDNLILSRARIGAMGIRKLNEGTITLSPGR